MFFVLKKLLKSSPNLEIYASGHGSHVHCGKTPVWCAAHEWTTSIALQFGYSPLFPSCPQVLGAMQSGQKPMKSGKNGIDLLELQNVGYLVTWCTMCTQKKINNSIVIWILFWRDVNYIVLSLQTLFAMYLFSIHILMGICPTCICHHNNVDVVGMVFPLVLALLEYTMVGKSRKLHRIRIWMH